MKEWLTAQEIAAEAFPYLPSTKRGINDLAEREGWNADVFRARRRSGRGGGMEYDIGLLPSVAQVAYRQRNIPVGPLPETVNVQPGAALSGRAALERDARLAILRAYGLFEKGQRLNRQGCECLFVSKYRAGTLAVDAWVKELIPAFSARTLARWRAAAAGDAGRLGVDRGAARKGKGMLETANGGAVRAWMLGVIALQPHLSAEGVREQCRGRFGDTIAVVRGAGAIETVPMPPLRTFQVALKALKVSEEVALAKRTDPDRFRAHMQLSGSGSLRHVDEPNQLWQIDASPVDALCVDGRHAIYACIDIATRRAVFYMAKTARAEAVGLLMRKAILAWGVPAEVKTDNGSDFVAKATKRLLLNLGIAATLSDKFSPEQKGHVERLIKTFQHGPVTLMPGFIGHSVADRKVIENRKGFAQRLGDDDRETFSVQCTAAEMQAQFDAWSKLKYEHTPHRGIGGKTPASMAEAAAHTIRRVDVRALDLLLAPAAGGDGTRVMTKTGIHVDTHAYHCGAVLPRQRVFVRRDPLDMGRISLFEPDGETFLGEGINADLAGLPAAAVLKAAREIRAQKIAERLAPIDAEMREIRKGPELYKVSREVWERDKVERDAARGDVLPFPRPEVEHTTPAIAAALDAAMHRDLALVVEISDPVTERLISLRQKVRATPNATPIRQELDTVELRFRWALDLEARIAAGEPVDPAEVLQLGAFQASIPYRVRRKVLDKRGAEKGGR